jgi:hypothetical protein
MVLPDIIIPEAFRVLTAYDTEEVFDWPQLLVQLDGIGLPPVVNYTVSAPSQHGGTYMGMLFEPRALEATFHLRDLWGPASPWEDHRTRQRLLDILNPVLQPYTFQLDMSNGDVYQLREVLYETGFEAGIQNGSRGSQEVAVRLRCMDPVWWGVERTVSMSLAAGSAIAATETHGNFYSFPEITLTGPLLNPTVQLVEWDGAAYTVLSRIGIVGTITAGNHVYITTALGERNAVDDAGDNVDLTDTTTFSTFFFSPHPIKKLHSMQADPSWYNNMIRIIANGYGGSATVVYSDRWSGI